MEKQLSQYNYASAKAMAFSLVVVRNIIDKLLANPTNDLYRRIEALLTEPGSTGRVSWDHCKAVTLILSEDAISTGELTAMVKAGTLSEVTLGTELIKQLRAANFIIHRGRITGVVENIDA